MGNTSSSGDSPLVTGGLQRDFRFKDVIFEEVKRLSFYAEVNVLSKENDKTRWTKYFPSVTQIHAQKCQDKNGQLFVRFSVGKEIEGNGIEIQLPISRLKKISDCFLQWRDKANGGAWGLNFVSGKDLKRFLRLCMAPTEHSQTRTLSSERASTNSTDSGQSQLSRNTRSNSSYSIHSSGTASSSGAAAAPTILVTDASSEQKPAIRKPLGPPLRKSRSLDHSVKGFNSGSSFESSYSQSPAIPVPSGFDPTEYEFLTRNNTDENDANNNDELDLGLGASAVSNSASNSSLFIPRTNTNNFDDSLSGVSEDFQDARPPSAINMNRQIMSTRKAAWLLVKNILIHSKKGKLELATSRKWRKYWVALKGVEMLFYQADEKSVTTDDMDAPSYQLDVDACLVQAVPEYARLENVFSLSTKHGNAYYLQATSQAEVENWIHCVHTSASAALARRKGKENITALLNEEIQAHKDKMLSDEKLRKMAVLQLKIEKDTNVRQTITDQILSWEQSLELLHSNIFRLSCYLAAIESTKPPNPQEILTHVSRSSKHALSKIGLFSVTSFHSYVNTKNAILPPPNDGKARRSSRQKAVKTNGIKARLLNSLKIADDNVVTAIRSRHSGQYRNKRSNGIGDAETSTKSSKSSKEHARKHAKPHGRVGDTLYIQLPNSATCALPYEQSLKISDLMERVCMTESYDSTDYFLILMMDDNKRHGLLDYTIPKETALLDVFQYSSVKLCPKLIYEVTLSNPADYEHGSFGLEMEQSIDERIIVTFVEDGSPARKSGIVVDDEVVEINGQNLRELNDCFNDILEVMNTSSSIKLKLRSKRIDDPSKTFQTTESMISFLVCPPPPKTIQPDLSDDLLNTLIVPAPTDFDEDGGSISTGRSFSGLSNGEANVEDIDQFLQKTEQVNMMTREMNAVAVHDPSTVPSMKPGVKLRKAIIELLETEKTYVKNLKILLERYLIPLREENFLSKDEAELLVTNVREISDFQTNFFDRLKEIVRSEKGFEDFTEASQYQNTVYSIGETFLEYVDKFKLYSTFCSCHSRAVKLLELNSNDALRAFLLARNPKQQHTGTLESYLITPIQRILRYPLLMKSMLKLMRKESEEYKCLHDALKSVEKVADYINEMQRISETYTPIFQELSNSYSNIEKNDMGVDNLLHYGRVQWINCSENLTTRRNSGYSSVSAGNEENENLTIFIFKRAVVLLSYDPKPKKKPGSSSNLKNGFKVLSDIKFHVIIPISDLLLRDHAWSENDTNQIWEIVDTSSDIEDQHVVYMFVNRTGEEKKVFVNAIKESRKLNKLSSSFPVLGAKTKQRRSKSPSMPNLTNINSNKIVLATNGTADNTPTKDVKVKRKPSIKKKPSFTKKTDNNHKITKSAAAGLASPILSRMSGKLKFGKSGVTL